MSGSTDLVEIFILALIAGFIGWRLVNVLGKRTGYDVSAGLERDPLGPSTLGSASAPVVGRGAPVALREPERSIIDYSAYAADVIPPLQAIAAADAQFVPQIFQDGAKAAYREILTHFWNGDATALRLLVSDELLSLFSHLIATRSHQVVTNQMVSIDAADIVDAHIEGAMAEITVRFTARINEGSNTPQQHIDIWTFRRHLKGTDPSWLLIASDSEDQAPNPSAA